MKSDTMTDQIPGSLDAIPRRRTSWGSLILRIAVSVALLALLVSQIDLESSLQIVAQARPELLILSLALMVLARYVVAFRWYVLLRGKNSAVTLRAVSRLVLTSTFLGYFLPGMGTEVLRMYGLSKATADPALVFASLLVERVTALFILIGFVLVGLLLVPLALSPIIGVVVGLSLFALVSGSLVLMHPRTRALTRTLFSAVWLEPLRTRLEKLYRCLDAYRDDPRPLLWSLPVGVVFQLLRILPVTVAAAAFGLDIPFVFWLVIVPVGLLLAMLPISIGGLGVRETTYVYLLGMVGISPEAAFSLSIVTYLLHILSVTPGAWIYARRGIAP